MIYTTREGVHYSLPEKTRQNAKYGLVGVLALIGVWLGGAGLHIGVPFSTSEGNSRTAAGQPVRLTSDSSQGHSAPSTTPKPSSTAQVTAPAAGSSFQSAPPHSSSANNTITPQSTATAAASNPVTSASPTTAVQGGMGGGSADTGSTSTTTTGSTPSTTGGTGSGTGAITLPLVGDPTTIVPDTSQTIDSLVP